MQPHFMRILYSLRVKKLWDYLQTMRPSHLGRYKGRQPSATPSLLRQPNDRTAEPCLSVVLARCVFVYHLWLSMALVISCIAYGSGLVRMKHESSPDMVMLHHQLSLLAKKRRCITNLKKHRLH
jgi:hypothetical protein